MSEKTEALDSLQNIGPHRHTTGFTMTHLILSNAYVVVVVCFFLSTRVICVPATVCKVLPRIAMASVISLK